MAWPTVLWVGLFHCSQFGCWVTTTVTLHIKDTFPDREKKMSWVKLKHHWIMQKACVSFVTVIVQIKELKSKPTLITASTAVSLILVMKTCLWCVVWCHGRAAPKVMLIGLLRWLVMSHAAAGGIAVQAEPSHQYSFTSGCCATRGSRGVVWHTGIWHEGM